LGVSREDDENIVSHIFNKMLTFTSGHFEIRKWPKNYQNLLRTFIETFTPNFIQIRLVVLNKEVKENNNNNKKQIQSWPFIYKPGEHKQQSKGKKNTQNYEPNASEAISV
jgi:hypothetical protein